MSPSRESSDFIPGTVHLVDLDGSMNALHAEKGKHDIVLVPMPSQDPDDPLNWSQRRKRLFVFCLCVYILAVGFASAAIYSVLVPITVATGLTIGDLVAGTGYMFLAFGWGCLIWQPLAQQFGKRPVYLLSVLATMAVMLWAPHTKNNGQWIANKVLQGLVGAPIESLCEISVSDVFFAHERGTYVGVYALFIAGANFAAPILSGFINDGQGWEWVLYWCAIFNGGAFLILLFLMEETNYDRPVFHGVEQEIPVSEGQSLEDAALRVNSPDPEKRLEVHSASPVSSARENAIPYSKKSYLQKLRFVRSEDIKKKVQLTGGFIRPLLFASFPIVFFCGFMYGAVICYFNVLNGTASVILSSSPYNFRPSMVGLSYVSCVLGVVFGFWFSGPLGDKFVLWKARRNNGIREPEYRLWLYCSVLILTPGALLIWGIGAAHQVHWVGLVVAMAMIAAGITIGCQLPISYCIDSYKDLGADAIVTVILIRNTMSFAVSYGISPWVTNMGLQNAFIVAAFAALAQTALVFVFIKWGKHFRKTSAPRYSKYLNQIGSLLKRVPEWKKY